ncbi:MAG TPA: sigma-70 family RNA polymerase sigma factor [Bacillota bacterium]|nr:sigma-70 family RNA polymerase sigma factor [Bacillota bacterium]
MPDTMAIIRQIQQGQEELREAFITSRRAQILRYTSYVCRRRLDWHNDDELSIALIAFNKAIDSFKPEQGHSFDSFARLVIRNSLVDYFRNQRQKDKIVYGLGETVAGREPERAAADLDYRIQEENWERAYEIECFKEMLGRFGLSLEDLALNSPRHRDTRESLKEAALIISRHVDLVKRIYQKKKLPLKEIQLLTGISRKTLEKWRKYLLSLIIIRTGADTGILADYIWGSEGLKAIARLPFISTAPFCWRPGADRMLLVEKSAPFTGRRQSLPGAPFLLYLFPGG